MRGEGGSDCSPTALCFSRPHVSAKKATLGPPYGASFRAASTRTPTSRGRRAEHAPGRPQSASTWVDAGERRSRAGNGLRPPASGPVGLPRARAAPLRARPDRPGREGGRSGSPPTGGPAIAARDKQFAGSQGDPCRWGCRLPPLHDDLPIWGPVKGEMHLRPWTGPQSGGALRIGGCRPVCALVGLRTALRAAESPPDMPGAPATSVAAGAPPGGT